MKKLLLLSLFFFAFHLGINAQCNFPSPPSWNCSNAPIICQLDGYCSTTPDIPNIIDQPNTFCGSPQNVQWIAFIADTTSIILDIEVGTCIGTSSGNGMQVLVFSECEGSWPTVSNCLYQIFPNSTSQLLMNNLVVGDIYYMMIDGFSGDVCDYTIHEVQGSTNMSSSINIPDAGPDQTFICTPITLDGSNSTIDANSTFEWTDQFGNSLSTNLSFSTSVAGSYYFVVTEAGGCEYRDEVIIVIDELYSLELGADTFLTCSGIPQTIIGDTIPMNSSYAYQWTTFDGNIVSGANTVFPVVNNMGTYVLTITDIVNNCSFSDSIIVYDFADVFSIETPWQWHCDPSLGMDAITFLVDASNFQFIWSTTDGIILGSNEEVYPFVGSVGTYNFQVTDMASNCAFTGAVQVIDTVDIVPQINLLGILPLTCSNTSVQLEGINSGGLSSIMFRWFNSSGFLIGNNSILDVGQPGVYTLEIIDTLTGCNGIEDFEITGDLDGENFSFNNDVPELNCANNFTEEVAPVFINSVNVSYSWTGPNNFTSSDSNVVFSGNIAGIFELVVTNLDNGCTSSQAVQVINNGFEMNVTTTTANCDMQDGTATVTTGLLNPSFEWSTGAQTTSISNLAQGWYSVTVTDLDNNCSKHQNVFVDEDISCKVVISGYVVNDPDTTCTFDPNLEGMECVMVQLNPLGIFTLTDSTGYYEFVVDDGSYTVEYIGAEFADLLCPTPSSYDVTLNNNGDVSDNNHFFIKRKEFDLCISKFTGNARPGFDQFNCVNVCNYSEEFQDALVSFTHDSIFSGQSPWPLVIPANNNIYASTYDYNASANTFNWILSNMAPGECRKIMWYMPVPSSAVIGETITGAAKVNPINIDINPDNNCLDWTQIITASYDPNDKRNMVGETQWGGIIYEDDETMEYAIRFQNVGNDTAFTVVIQDTLDNAHLDVTTLRSFNSSHDMQVEFEGTNVLTFRFENIMLVDSMTNEPESNGWVSFRIDRKPDLDFGTEIINQAAIYFDYNDPIITNEVVNVLTDIVKVFTLSTNEIQVKVIPTVTSENVLLEYELKNTSPVSIQIYNVEGVLLKTNELGKRAAGIQQDILELKDISAGMYFIYLQTEEGSAVKRVIKI